MVDDAKARLRVSPWLDLCRALRRSESLLSRREEGIMVDQLKHRRRAAKGEACLEDGANVAHVNEGRRAILDPA
jgi:hypothetical protein